MDDPVFSPKRYSNSKRSKLREKRFPIVTRLDRGRFRGTQVTVDLVLTSKVSANVYLISDMLVTENSVYRQLAEMHQNLLRKFERESKAMKRLSMNNEELMWKLSQSDVGPLDDDDGRGQRATTTREAAGGLFISATLPSRGSRGSSGSRAMSRSYDSPRTMFGLTASGARQRGPKSTSTEQRAQSTVPAKTDSENTSISSASTSTSTSDSANSRLRRSGTYDVVEDE